MSNRVAIIDMGTNTFHLLIAETGQPPRIIYRDRVAVRIGQGGINAGAITAEAQERALVTMRSFKKKISELDVGNVSAYGTSAIRNATNGRDFVDRVKKETGIDTHIIDGEEEATLIFEGVRHALDLGEDKSLMVDVGGGSVEFIIGNRNDIVWKHSFEVGGQRLLERFHRHDPILPKEIDDLNKYLRKELSILFEQLVAHRPSVLVGVSGTFDTLSEIYCLEKGFPYLPDDPETPLTLESFHKTYSLLAMKNRVERMAVPGMIEMRVDMIVTACCLVKLVLDSHPFEKIRVSTWSLKEGALMKHLSKTP